MDKRTKIVVAAQKLFQEQGLGFSTMEDVAKAVGMGKSSLYYYFKSKEEIFDAVLDAEINEVILETTRQLSRQQGLVEKLVAFASVKLAMARKRKSLFRAMEAGMDAELFSKYTEQKKALHRRYLEKETLLLQQLLLEGANRHEINLSNNKQLGEAIFIFLSALRGMNREFIVHDSDADPYKMLSAFCSVFCKGLE
ncbi:TetR/AcrR family transcriptional regulator [Niabella soli]|uniref:HTH tetR-type domain-containing protein n=1 Tax=Niabella soli DSM 19437 TaxID=929713 RepID=W0F296_9BACT|nr:TetR/AcrR family transcriptional regulator [Niabella soli]AHF17127.1 hypothetical protein NIASO_02210 [Niabella soli DSM 19437]